MCAVIKGQYCDVGLLRELQLAWFLFRTRLHSAHTDLSLIFTTTTIISMVLYITAVVFFFLTTSVIITAALTVVVTTIIKTMLPGLIMSALSVFAEPLLQDRSPPHQTDLITTHCKENAPKHDDVG